MFKRGVKTVTKEFVQKLEENGLINLIYLSPRMQHSTGNFYNCDNCHLYLQRNELPPLNTQNGMDIDDIPEELDLTPLEKQLISKNLYFLKVRKLPKTQMDILNDRVINVPIGDDDLLKTARSLPRSSDNGLVPINLKRKMDLKSCYKSELIRPEKIYKALFWLKENHPSYKDIQIKDFDSWMNEVLFDYKSNKTKEDENEWEDVDEIGVPSETVNPTTSNASDENQFNLVTCLMPEDPTGKVIFNRKRTVLKKKLKQLGRKIYNIAPGEGKIPTNWIREKDFDINAFPEKFSKGRFGLNWPRKKKLSPIKYFAARLLNMSNLFARDPDFLFIAQQFCERFSIERNINCTMRKGQVVTESDGTKNIKNPQKEFSVFEPIP